MFSDFCNNFKPPIVVLYCIDFNSLGQIIALPPVITQKVVRAPILILPALHPAALQYGGSTSYRSKVARCPHGPYFNMDKVLRDC